MSRLPPPPGPSGSEPSSGNSLAARLRRRFGDEVDPRISLLSEAEPAALPADARAQKELERLKGQAPRETRYRVLEALARGGMGAVYKVWDEDLRRQLAMKVAMERGAAEEPRAPGGRSLARFLEEAQVTGQLDHPGIVPVHELGLDEHGRVYFTMRLVKGRSFEAILRLVRTGAEGWNPTRALFVLLRVCEAMAYAHQKGVIHRDLKPANVMVGRFGEVYVVDWGLARVLGREDLHDLRLAAAPAKEGETDELRASGLYTMDGDIIGTPVYMSPEQANPRLGTLGPQADVYALGAVLYELLAGTPPYLRPGESKDPRVVVALLEGGPPRPVADLARGVSPELVAICEKAMERAPERRYPDMLSLAEDLRAYLEGRVVGAYEAGLLAECKKWVARNRGLAASLTAAAVLALVGLLGVIFVQARANQAILRLSDVKRLRDQMAEADALWPALPGKLPEMERWMEGAERLVETLPVHEAALADLRRQATSSAEADGSVRYRFADGETQWQHDTLAGLVEGLHALSDPDPFRGAMAGMKERMAFAADVERRSLVEPQAEWREAHVAIADPARNPAYEGLVLQPQLGLVPLGRDPRSGLWEFAHLQSGTPPRRGADGELVLAEDMGIVLVLVPGGRFRMGAQATDPTRPNYDALAKGVEAPVRELELAPFFLSKFELTQAQWLRITGRNPSQHQPPDGGWNGGPITGLNPVEQVSWEDCQEVFRRLGLTFPTEAQWEYAVRAGSSTSYFAGAERESLIGAINIADRTALEGGVPWDPVESWLSDGWVTHAPVGTYRPNAWGLCEMTGNIWEWCRDGLGDYASSVEEESGLRKDTDLRMRVVRGGGFDDIGFFTRSSSRLCYSPDSRYYALGVRPARALDP